jgi:hypothetical protein
MRGTIPPGVAVPLHSHADPETFLLVSGSVQGLAFRGDDFEWITITAGDVFHVPDGAKHGFRNDGDEDAVMMITSTAKIGRFFREPGVAVRPGSAPSPPTPERIRRLFEASVRYGYWNASRRRTHRSGSERPSDERHPTRCHRSGGAVS